jgi:cephalosporin-C deacetylase-like acetyl esterase
MDTGTIILIVIFFGGGILLATLLFALFISLHVSRPRRRTYMDHYVFSPFETGVPAESVSFTTADGVTLRGWWLVGSRDRVVIGLCGRMGTKSDLLGVGSYLNKAGYHVLLFDYRDCGESERAVKSMGALEQRDVTAAIDFVHTKMPNAPIGIIGFSLGASLGIVAASGDPRISALVSDCPFSSSKNLIAGRLGRFFPLPLPLLFWGVRLWTRLLFGHDNRNMDIISAAQTLKLNDHLVIVSGSDSVIPPSQQRDVYEAAPHPKTLWEDKMGEHCEMYFIDRKKYVERIISFFDNALGPPNKKAE